MQKVTAFLEQHVQWIAIGLGALFCLYMIYAYVITPPAEVTIGSESFGPSEVDPHTAETVAAKLRSAMSNTAKIRMEVPQYVQGFQDAMTWKNAKPVQLAGMTDPSYARDVQLPAPPQDPNAPPQPLDPNRPPQPEIVAGAKIKQLPVPPTPRQTDPNTFVKYGRSLVVPPPPPGQPPVAVQPGIVPPGAVDTDWVTQMWVVSMPQIEAAFRAAGMQNAPQGVKTTMFLHVEMVREENLGGDKWGNPTVIPHRGPTRNNQPMMPYPGDGPDPNNPSLRQAQFQYAAWASTSTPDIIQPLFHVTVPNMGDAWMKPGAQIVAAMFNPATHVGGKGNLTDEQWQQVLQYRQEQYKLRIEQNRQGRPAPGPRGPRGPQPAEGMDGGEGMYAPRQRSYAPAREQTHLPHYAPAPRIPPYPTRGGYGGYNPNLPPDAMEMEGMDMGGGYGGPQAVNMPQPGTDYPNGEFDPLDPAGAQLPWKLKDVEIWAHDDQVVAGKTYRYKMRYRLKNPIFGAANASDPPELADKFALVSEFSDWTTPVTVPALVNFFVAGGVVPGRTTVAFEIFRWDQGQQKMERFDVAPGDTVGWAKNGVDFTTDWTVVDFLEDPRAGEKQILLVNNKDGSVVARSYSGDRNDKLYKALKDQVKAATDAANTAAGIVPPGNGTAAAR
jgi:hypothetical protein